MTPEARRVALDRITLNVVEGGDGPAVLLLHGFPDRATLWRLPAIRCPVLGV